MQCQPPSSDTMYSENKYIRLDWAAKRMLRDKANFAVLEGLITVLIGEAVHIIEILKSEGNQEICRLTGLTADELVAMQQG